MCRTLGVGLDHSDYEKLLRIVSLLESKNRSQKLINRSYLKRQNPTCIAYVLCGLHMYTSSIQQHEQFLLLLAPGYSVEIRLEQMYFREAVDHLHSLHLSFFLWAKSFAS